VILAGMGAGNGAYLVETIVRTETSRMATVTCVRPLPTLPEPKNAGATADAGEGDFTVPTQEKVTAASPSATAEAFVQVALSEQGKPYRWGASGPAAFDCSGLVQYCANKVGVHTVHKPVSAIYEHIKDTAVGYIISVDQAIATRGSVLIRISSAEGNHIAISLGNGQTMEAHGKATGCGIYPAHGRLWTAGAIIPGIEVEAKAKQSGQGETVGD
jgi:cell wall-associated NlpC family hydrolase